MKPGDSALTEVETRAFQQILDSARSSSLCVLRVELNGIAKAALCEVYQYDEDGSYEVRPLALLLDPATFQQLTPPGDPEWATEEEGGDGDE